MKRYLLSLPFLALGLLTTEALSQSSLKKLCSGNANEGGSQVLYTNGTGIFDSGRGQQGKITWVKRGENYILSSIYPDVTLPIAKCYK